MKIKVNKPSTFFTNYTEVVILDSKKFPFYFHTNKAKHLTFNLPKGTYYSNVPVKRQPKFIPYGTKTYPRFKKGVLQRIKIYRVKNPNKASISLETAQIFVDPLYYDNPYKPLLTFTIMHEIFHHFFHAKTEREKKNIFIHQYIEAQCDNAAKNFMLANGWNPSQVRMACKMLLRSKWRNKCIQDNTTHPKNQFRR